MSYKDKQRIARSLYVKSDLTRKEIAEQCGVTEKTLRDWIEKFEWDKEKDSETITRSKLLQDSYKQLKAINLSIETDHKGVPTKQLADAKGVIRKEIEALSEMPLHKYVEVFMELLDYVSKNNPEKTGQIAETCDSFISQLSKEKGI